jgi:ATP-dependent RNA helicase HelY
VGLLTGDNSINGDAPIVVMTTEVLRNMIYAASPALDGLRWVVLDEVHYLQDRYRGPVWEEVIVHLDASVGLVCLSATVSNAEEVATWIETVRGPTAAVIEEHRPVTLENRYLVGERGRDTLHLLPTFSTQNGQLRPNPDAARLDARATGTRARAAVRARRCGHQAASRRSSASTRKRCSRRSRSCSAGPAATRRCSSAWPPGSGSPIPPSARRSV